MKALLRVVGWISDLRVAIVLLLVIAITSGVGTAIPQREPVDLYHRLYDPQPWLGLLNGDGVLALQLDHVYSSGWFLGLLAWLALALLLCSWRRQWPALQAALRWIDYSTPRQLSKLSVAETLSTNTPKASLDQLAGLLQSQGWQIQRHDDRLAARKGLLGRVGPLLVHAGMVVLMLGAAWGALGGQRAEQYLAPGRSLELMDSRGSSQLTLALDHFSIQRDPAGRPEQFTSQLRILEGDGSGGSLLKQAEISVNHPLRFQGVTLYQADWALATADLEADVAPRAMRLVHGRAPEGLTGTLFRNGPGKFRRPGGSATHWFDGDGLMRAFRVHEGQVSLEARFADTPKRRWESEIDAVVTPGFGTAGDARARIGSNDDANAANTAVMVAGDEVWLLP